MELVSYVTLRYVMLCYVVNIHSHWRTLYLYITTIVLTNNLLLTVVTPYNDSLMHPMHGIIELPQNFTFRSRWNRIVGTWMDKNM